MNSAATPRTPHTENGDLVCILDVGKTNGKVSLVHTDTGAVVASSQRGFHSVAGPVVRELDLAGIEQWLWQALAQMPDKERVHSLVPIAHGAAAVLLDKGGDVLLAPDYEDPVFDTVQDEYRAERDPFEATLSPFLPLGLNLGRQLYYLQKRHTQLLSHARQLLLYPQYWAWRLSGVGASELTSLGCHTDLWRVPEKRPSGLAQRHGWVNLLPPLRAPGDALGLVSAQIAQLTGLPTSCRVVCGIHDSNAAYLGHLASRDPEHPFAVISSGTWTIVMAHGTDLSRIRESYDMLANIDAFGSPVATARFMGGREYESIAGVRGCATPVTREALVSVIRQRAFALPSFATAGGPFAGRPGRLVHGRDLETSELSALATLYVALVADFLLDLLGVAGDVIIDGPLAETGIFGELLAALRPRNRIGYGGNRDASMAAGCYLAGNTGAPSVHTRIALPASLDELDAYRNEWRRYIDST